MVYRHPVNTTHLYDFVQCWTNVEDVGPTLYKCYRNVLCLLGRRTFSQTVYICAMLVQCWASVADVGLTLKQRWVSVRWSSIQSYNQVTSSTTLYCILKAYTHASLEPDSIFNSFFIHSIFVQTLSDMCALLSSVRQGASIQVATGLPILTNVGLMFGLRRRWWANIKTVVTGSFLY